MSKRSVVRQATGDEPSRRRRRHVDAWIVFAVTGCLTLVMATPVLYGPTERLFGSEIVGRVHDPFTVADQFENPASPGLYTQPVTDYLGALLAALLGSGIAAYNLVVLASFPLASLAAFLFSRHLTGSLAASWIAALAFGFAPFHVAHAAYHPHVAQTFWLPLYFLALLRLLARPDRVRVGLFVLAALAVVFSNYYGGLIAAVLTPFALLGLRAGGRSRSVVGTGTASLALGTVGAVVIVAAWVAFAAPRVVEDPRSLAFPLDDAARYSARWEGFILPPVEHPLWGSLADVYWQQQGVIGALVEQQLTLGLGLLLLAAVAVVGRIRRPLDPRLRSVPLLSVLAAAAFVFSLPPRWNVAGFELFAPSGLLHSILPMFRAYARFGIVVQLTVAIMAGIGAVELFRRRRGAAHAIAAALLVVASVEIAPFPPWRWRDVLPTAGHRWLDRESGPVRLLDCVPASDPATWSVQRLFRHPIRFLGADEDCGDPDFTVALAAEGMSHLLVREDSILRAWWSRGYAPRRLEPVAAFADSVIWKIPPQEPTAFVRALEGLSWREYQNGRSFRWMAERARLELVLLDERATEGYLELSLHAFPDERRVVVDVGDRTVATLVVGTDPATHLVGPMLLARGAHPVTITAPEPAVVADRVLHNGDQRPLAVALGRWRWVSARSSTGHALSP